MLKYNIIYTSYLLGGKLISIEQTDINQQEKLQTMKPLHQHI
jgi:hypothetical protein